MENLDLFSNAPADPPIARRSDPKTSHQAAAKYTATSRPSHKQILRELIAELPHLTANEYTQVLMSRGFKPMTAHRIPNKRVNDLLKDGSIAVSSVRKCEVTGHNCRTYHVRRDHL